ncbi:unnamed protein product [Heterobilharzia americana]|nr:unnamed protein product [Heterobilharzia americana]
MSLCDPREEEAEVLRSIFDDQELSVLSDYNLEYKVGEQGTASSFVVQIHWPLGYPDVLPCISMDAFYNSHVPSNVKETIVKELLFVAKDQLGSALTFTLIEYLKENSERFTKLLNSGKVEEFNPSPFSNETTKVSLKPDKQLQLSKAQKRKQQDRLGQNGELPRGWNWVSVIKHLQQSGSTS